MTSRSDNMQNSDERDMLLRLMFEAGLGWLTRIAADGTVLYMNPAGLNVIGGERETDVHGLSVYELVVPEHRDRFKRMHQEVIHGTSQTLQFKAQGFTGGAAVVGNVCGAV